MLCVYIYLLSLLLVHISPLTFTSAVLTVDLKFSDKHGPEVISGQCAHVWILLCPHRHLICRIWDRNTSGGHQPGEIRPFRAHAAGSVHISPVWGQTPVRCAVHGVRMVSRSFEGRWENITQSSSSSHTRGSGSFFAPARCLKMHRPLIDGSPAATLWRFPRRVRARKRCQNKQHFRIRDATLSLHVLARHNNNTGSSFHHPAPQQRGKNFLLPKSDIIVI